MMRFGAAGRFLFLEKPGWNGINGFFKMINRVKILYKTIDVIIVFSLS